MVSSNIATKAVGAQDIEAARGDAKVCSLALAYIVADSTGGDTAGTQAGHGVTETAAEALVVVLLITTVHLATHGGLIRDSCMRLLRGEGRRDLPQGTPWSS